MTVKGAATRGLFVWPITVIPAACPSLLPHVSPEGFADRESFTPRGDACGA